MRALLDSDVLIDYLQGNENAKREIGEYRKREMSIISWMEVLAGAESEDEERGCRQFLDTFTVHPLTAEIAEEAIHLRRKFSLRLPDAIIWATARVNGILLVTRNSRDFSPGAPGIRIPYKA